MPTTINSNFIADYNLGDNINYNLAILRMLYASHAESNRLRQALHRKPITILNISIMEAVLYDFHLRAQTFTREGISNLHEKILEYIRSKKLDKLNQYIASAKKHDLFDLADTDFYDRLDELRRLRNRVHIQNTESDFEAKDAYAFSEARKILSEQALEQVMLTMAAKFPREHKYVDPFVLPWDTHFPPEA